MNYVVLGKNRAVLGNLLCGVSAYNTLLIDTGRSDSGINKLVTVFILSSALLGANAMAQVQITPEEGNAVSHTEIGQKFPWSGKSDCCALRHDLSAVLGF